MIGHYFASYPKPLPHDEAVCEASDMKIYIFFCCNANKTHYVKGFKLILHRVPILLVSCVCMTNLGIPHWYGLCGTFY